MPDGLMAEGERRDEVSVRGRRNKFREALGKAVIPMSGFVLHCSACWCGIPCLSGQILAETDLCSALARESSIIDSEPKALK